MYAARKHSSDTCSQTNIQLSMLARLSRSQVWSVSHTKMKL
jgi:hypothetical protein